MRKIHDSLRIRKGIPKKKKKRLFIECPSSDGQQWYCGGHDLEKSLESAMHAIREDVRQLMAGESDDYIDIAFVTRDMTDDEVASLLDV